LKFLGADLIIRPIGHSSGCQINSRAGSIYSVPSWADLAGAYEYRCRPKQDNVYTNTESVQCISIVYSICP